MKILPIAFALCAASTYTQTSVTFSAKYFDPNGTNVTFLTDPTMGQGAGFYCTQKLPATKSQSCTIHWAANFYSNNPQSNTPDSYIPCEAVLTNNPSAGVGVLALPASGSATATAGNATATCSRSTFGNSADGDKKTMQHLLYDLLPQWTWSANGGWSAPWIEVETTTLTGKATMSCPDNGGYYGYASASSAQYIK